MPLSLRIAPAPTAFCYSPTLVTVAGGLGPVKQHCRIPNSGVATRSGFCSGGVVLDSGKRRGSCVVRCSLETVNVSVGQVTEADKDTFWPIVKAAGDMIVVLDMYTQWYVRSCVHVGANLAFLDYILVFGNSFFTHSLNSVKCSGICSLLESFI
ncbi:unnamed protein product [Microthlaspi erraticum]|uniref:Uncharacterized protein n=1 Tax=Microthlaspi erraticum TaxID=1685480 RepID=A0A6D2K790_9BRAS|nr:unnamed protein product [Microthlaspi erraticum]